MVYAALKIIATSAMISLLIALVLVFSQRPGGAVAPPGEGLKFSALTGGDMAETPEQFQYDTRRGGQLSAWRLRAGAKDVPLLVMVHGSGWYGQQFHTLMARLQGQADLIAPDLRGHGMTPQRRGDIDYINQLEDDLADLIQSQARPGQRVILLGHSSGGGLVVRFAGGAHRELVDGAILLAPFLKYNAPTTRANSGGWAQVLTRRMIGLSMLNAVRITALNHLPVIEFTMPETVLNGPLGQGATTRYSYRLNTGYAPRSDYQRDIAALPNFQLIVGADDEAMIADAYGPLMSGLTDRGQYHVVPAAGHLDIVNTAQTEILIREFLHAE